MIVGDAGTTLTKIAANVTGVDVTFAKAVTADGADQTFDAKTGTLLASSTITKTSTGNLTLSGVTLVDLEGAVDVQDGDLVITDKVDAEGDLTASGSVTLNELANLAGDVTGVDVTFDKAVTADGSDQTFDAKTGTLLASSTITKTSTGKLTLSGVTLVDLEGAVDVQKGDLEISDNVTVAAGKTLKASSNVILADHKTLTGEGDLTLEATNGAIAVAKIDMLANNETLTLTQNDAINMANFSVTNDKNTDLVANSTGSSVKSEAADEWKSTTATAVDNIELSGTGDIIIGGDLTSTSGGVKIVSSAGGIYDKTSGTTLDNVAITGTSNGTTGVDLPDGTTTGGKAAIVIQSKSKLTLGANTTLTANGSYSTSTDDRSPYTRIDTDGSKNDIAIYVESTENNIGAVDSTIAMPSNATMVIAAKTIVNSDSIDRAFGGNFTSSDPWSVASNRLELVSNDSPSIEEAIRLKYLPHARITRGNIAPTWFHGASEGYVLRGDIDPDNLWEVLAAASPVPLVAPIQMDIENRSYEVGDVRAELLARLIEELGEENIQIFLEDAQLEMYATDLQPSNKVISDILDYAAILKDGDGTGLASLFALVERFVASDAPASEEQYASIISALKTDSTGGSNYADAGKWLDALVAYVGTLNTGMHRSGEDSIRIVMQNYGPRLDGESGDMRASDFIEIYLRSFAG